MELIQLASLGEFIGGVGSVIAKPAGQLWWLVPEDRGLVAAPE